MPSDSSGCKHEQVLANIGEDLIWERNAKLLGMTIDRDLKFDKHVLKLCSKANQKLSALSKMAKSLSFNKRWTLLKSFVESQFKYCPIVWMFHSRRTKNKINRLDERAFRIVSTLINYLKWTKPSVFTIKIFRDF